MELVGLVLVLPHCRRGLRPSPPAQRATDQKSMLVGLDPDRAVAAKIEEGVDRTPCRYQSPLWSPLPEPACSTTWRPCSITLTWLSGLPCSRHSGPTTIDSRPSSTKGSPGFRSTGVSAAKPTGPHRSANASSITSSGSFLQVPLTPHLVVHLDRQSGSPASIPVPMPPRHPQAPAPASQRTEARKAWRERSLHRCPRRCPVARIQHPSRPRLPPRHSSLA